MSEPTPAEITAAIERHESEIARRYVEAAKGVLEDARDDMIEPELAWQVIEAPAGNMDWVRA